MLGQKEEQTQKNLSYCNTFALLNLFSRQMVLSFANNQFSGQKNSSLLQQGNRLILLKDIKVGKKSAFFNSQSLLYTVLRDVGDIAVVIKTMLKMYL